MCLFIYANVAMFMWRYSGSKQGVKYTTQRSLRCAYERTQMCPTSRSPWLLCGGRRLSRRTLSYYVAHLYNSKNSNYQIDHVYLPEVRTLEAQWQTLADEGEKIRFAQEHVAARSQRISVSSCTSSLTVR